MKKVILLILIISLPVTILFSAGRISIAPMGNYFAPANADFKAIYGDHHFLPEVELHLKIVKGFYLWTSYSYLKAEGTTITMFNEPTEWRQSFLSAGGGYEFKLSPGLYSYLQTGIVHTRYEEESMGDVFKDTASGLFFGGGLIYDLGRNIYSKLEIAYLSISDTITAATVKLGGFKAGMGIGLKF